MPPARACTRSARRSCRVTRIVLLVVALVAMAEAVRPAFAQDGLYGPGAEPDAAWIRAVNARDPGGLGMRLNDGPLLSVAFGDATAYRAVEPGSVPVDLGGVRLEVDMPGGAFFTVVATGADPLVIEDEALIDVSRGLLGLMNLTDRPALTLATDDGTPVVEDVPPGAHRAVAVAQAEVGLRVEDDAGELGTVEPRLLERGVAHAVLVVDGPDGPLVRLVASARAE